MLTFGVFAGNTHCIRVQSLAQASKTKGCCHSGKGLFSPVPIYPE